MSTPQSVRPSPFAVVTLVVAIAALVLSLTRDPALPDPGPPPSTDSLATPSVDFEEALNRLWARVEAIERDRALEGPTPQPTVENDPPPAAPVVTRTSGIAVEDLQSRLAALEIKVQSLLERKRGFAKPDAIPAALAVLLASRGVVIDIGDVEAIKANAEVLADLVRDPAAPEWQRLEAYRGLLVFALDEQATSTLTDVAAMLWSEEQKVRLTAAALLTNLMQPSLSDVLTRAYYRETDEPVRGEIVSRLIQCIDDPRARQTLDAAARTEASAAIRQRIAAALAKAKNR